MGSFIADFYCAEKSLIVEIDGPHHEYQKAYDQRRHRFLEKHGLTVLHIASAEVFEELEGVLKKIESLVMVKKSYARKQKINKISPLPFKGEG